MDELYTTLACIVFGALILVIFLATCLDAWENHTIFSEPTHCARSFTARSIRSGSIISTTSAVSAPGNGPPNGKAQVASNCMNWATRLRPNTIRRDLLTKKDFFKKKTRRGRFSMATAKKLSKNSSTRTIFGV